MSADLILRNAEIDGHIQDLRVRRGLIAEIDFHLRGGNEMDCAGGALIPGLIDHHIHLLATAAKADSIDVTDAKSPDDFASRIRESVTTQPRNSWVRVIGYHERSAGVFDRDALDKIAPDHLLRVQHQTGALWILNSKAVEAVDTHDSPLERDEQGRATGRLWRSDAWLRSMIGDTAPLPLHAIGAALAAYGVTGLTDASVTTDASACALLANAHRAGALPQNLMLMSGDEITAPDDKAFEVGPVKILLDEHALPDFEFVGQRIAQARQWGRAVAAHCVTATEFAFMIAAFEAYGARAGDRIEHGGVIPAQGVSALIRLGLTTVTQPGFIFERGDRYRTAVGLAEQNDLYRCASLVTAGAKVASSSDAPYGSFDPWLAMRTARDRRTRGGVSLASGERVSPEVALRLYWGSFHAPGETRAIVVGAPADLCLLKTSLDNALYTLASDMVAATIVRGEAVYVAV